MSSTAASPLPRTAAPFAAAHAARPRIAAHAGFRSLVEDEADDQRAPSPAAKPPPTSARLRTPAAANADTKGARSSSTAGPAAADAVQTPVATPPAVLAKAAETAAGAGTQTAAADQGDGTPPLAAASLPISSKAPPVGPSIVEPAPDELADADEEAGGTGETVPAGAQVQGQGGAPAAPSSGSTAPPTLAAGSPAQPLMAALGGSGATLVKAQASPTPTGLRAAAAIPARGKGTLAAPDLTGEATAALLVAAPAEPTPAPFLPALADPPAKDPADDDATDDGAGNADDAAAGASQAGFVPTASVQAQGPSQATGTATPMSASAADLAAQMAARVAAGSSRFQLQLNPLGLGRVDVSVAIGRDRRLTAALSFADPQTASALSAHAGELKTVLEQAGFNVPADGFDFTSGAGAPGADLQGGFGSGGGLGGDSSGGSGRGRMAAFSAGEALAATGANDATAWTASGDSRLDIRI